MARNRPACEAQSHAWIRHGSRQCRRQLAQRLEPKWLRNLASSKSVLGGSLADHPNEVVGGGGHTSVAGEPVRAIDHDRTRPVVIDSSNKFVRNGHISTTTHHLVGVVGRATSWNITGEVDRDTLPDSTGWSLRAPLFDPGLDPRGLQPQRKGGFRSHFGSACVCASLLCSNLFAVDTKPPSCHRSIDP